MFGFRFDPDPGTGAVDGLISKKEVLAKYGISYGALYRWKRMGLIPEEWFIKKATVTGQETFFDRNTICERIELILSQKDQKGLADLADQLDPTDSKEKKLAIYTTYGKKVFTRREIIKIAVEGSGFDDITRIILDKMEEN